MNCVEIMIVTGKKSMHDIDCDEWPCDDEGIDDDIDSGIGDIWACDEIVVLEGIINDDVDSKETCDVDTCDEVVVFKGIDDGADGKETCGVAGTCDEACCVFVMFSGGGLSGTSNCSKSSINPFSMLCLVSLVVFFVDVCSPTNFLFFPIFPVIRLVSTDLLSSVT